MQHHFGALAAFAAALCAGQSSGEQPQFLWEGDVADFCILTIHGTAVQSREADGTPASHERHRFRAKLPDTNQTLSLQMLHGRGVARFLSQPTLNNGYTAVIRIDDPQPGSSHYTVALHWQESPYNQAGDVRRQKTKPAEAACCDAEAFETQHGASWSGHVDGTVRVSMRGSSSYSEIISGHLSGEHADVLRPLPRQAGLRYTITKVSGGGDVQLIEPPAEANGYTLTFEVRDGQSTRQDYQVNIGWAPQPAAR